MYERKGKERAGAWLLGAARGVQVKVAAATGGERRRTRAEASPSQRPRRREQKKSREGAKENDEQRWAEVGGVCAARLERERGAPCDAKPNINNG